MSEGYVEQVLAMLRFTNWHECTDTEAARQLNRYGLRSPQGTDWNADILREFTVRHGLERGIPSMAHLGVPLVAAEWTPSTILRCVERGWRRDQAALRQAIRQDDHVRAMVEALTVDFASHPWQPDVYEFWHNYARHFQRI